MVYAILQALVIAAALAFSLQHVARKLFPRAFDRVMQTVVPRRFKARIVNAEPAKGCGDGDGCGSCNACGNIAAMLRDVPRR